MWGNLIYGHPGRLNIQILTKSDTKIPVHYAYNSPIWTIWYCKVTIRKCVHNLSVPGVAGFTSATLWKKYTPPLKSTPKKKYHQSCLLLNIYLWLLCIIKWFKLGSYLRNTDISVSFLSKICVFDPLVCPYIRLPNTVLQLI